MTASLRTIGRYDFEDEGFVEIRIGGDVSTDDALEMVEVLVRLKREELERIAGTPRIPTNDS